MEEAQALVNMSAAASAISKHVLYYKLDKLDSALLQVQPGYVQWGKTVYMQSVHPQ